MVQYKRLFFSFCCGKVFKEGWSWLQSIRKICIGVQKFSMLVEIDITYHKCLSIYCCVKSKYIDTPGVLFATCAHPLDPTGSPQFFRAVLYALLRYMHLFRSVNILNLVMFSPLRVTTLSTSLFLYVKSPIKNSILSFRLSITFSAFSSFHPKILAAYLESQ